MVSQLPVEVCESKLSFFASKIEAPVTPVSQLQFPCQSQWCCFGVAERCLSHKRTMALDVTLL